MPWGLLLSGRFMAAVHLRNRRNSSMSQRLRYSTAMTHAGTSKRSVSNITSSFLDGSHTTTRRSSTVGGLQVREDRPLLDAEVGPLKVPLSSRRIDSSLSLAQSSRVWATWKHTLFLQRITKLEPFSSTAPRSEE